MVVHLKGELRMHTQVSTSLISALSSLLPEQCDPSWRAIIHSIESSEHIPNWVTLGA